MADYDHLPIADDEMLPGRPGKTSLFFRLRNNVFAMIQRGAGAPWLNGVGASQSFAANGTFTVPTGVFRIRVIATGGGGGGEEGQYDDDGVLTGQNNGADGGSSGVFGDTFAPGGKGGGKAGYSIAGMRSANGGQGGSGSRSTNINSEQGRNGDNGAGGEIRYKEYTVTPGDNITIVVGSGGAGGSGTSNAVDGESGGNGYVIVEY